MSYSRDIDVKNYQGYNKVLYLTIDFRNNYLESVRYYFDHYIWFTCFSYDDKMDFIYNKFKNVEFEEYTVTETFKILDKEEIDLSREARRRRARESTKKYREQAFKEVRDNMKKLIDSINHYYDV